MHFVDLTWSAYRVPFSATFLTAHGVLHHRLGTIVTARLDSGYVGYGEIAPLPEHNRQHLYAASSALHALAQELRGRELHDVLRFLNTQHEECRLPSSLTCGIETALLDALGQASNQRVADLLASDPLYGKDRSPGLVRACVPVNAVIGGSTIEAAVAHAHAAITAGFPCLKLKLTDTSQASIERVAAIRAAIGPEPLLRLDANESWNIEQARDLLRQCATYDIQYVEQPLPAHDLAGMAHLRRVTPIPLAADEALTGLVSARRILNAQAADVLILKPQLAGGLRVCRQIIQEASEQRVACVITSALETGIGVTAALHLAAASPEVTFPCGLATLALLENDLLLEGLPVSQGTLGVPTGHGLGVHLDQAALKRFADL